MKETILLAIVMMMEQQELKEQRAKRRKRNIIAKDLRTRKYAQRIESERVKYNRRVKHKEDLLEYGPNE